MPSPYRDYLTQIEAAYKAGNATENTYRPTLKSLLEALAPGVTATNEPRRIKCGAPDYIITRDNIPVGFVEAKDIGVSLDEAASGEQLARYRASLHNLILTDYLEFRWYAQGEQRLAARLAKIQANGKLRMETDGVRQLRELLQGFLSAEIPTISSPKELAVRMAALAQLICSIIGKTFTEEGEQGALHDQMAGFRKVLMHDLTAEKFADMYAQTICYGLFAARCNSTGARFTRDHAAYDLPKTNPFLRNLFEHIAGANLDDRIAWVVDNLAELLNRADMAAVLEGFGHSTRQHDPVVHFYETFLGAYDQKMRKSRGVYYTPEPVVAYIVRSVDAILRKDFNMRDGLADATMVEIERRKKKRKKSGKFVTHKIQILDPAVGTGTFLHHVIVQIHETFSGNEGVWASYVKDHLLPRLYGFEILMAPYAVAHMKLGLLLRETGYDFKTDERLHVYLTDTLEQAHEDTGLTLFAQWLADEANRAAGIKKDAPIMVVLGNPPYFGLSTNCGKWILDLLHGIDISDGQPTSNYFQVDGQPLNERKQWLNDDYVKFIRFAQWRIDRTGYGVLGFITNNGYLDNLASRGMRQSLMQSFDDIYILNLHGSIRKRERSPDGSKDENVFDKIQQGVAIGLFVKRGQKSRKSAKVYYADLYGTRAKKDAFLGSNDHTTMQWQAVAPHAPFHFFVPKNESFSMEYSQGWDLAKIAPINDTCIITARDNFVTELSCATLEQRITRFLDGNISDADIRSEYFNGKGSHKYPQGDTRSWKVGQARAELRKIAWREKIRTILYHPFDHRAIIYTPIMVDWPRPGLMPHMLEGKNLGLLFCRQTKDDWGVFVTRHIAAHKSLTAYDITSLLPLYLYPIGQGDMLNDVKPRATPGGRSPNLEATFIAELSARLKLSFVQDGMGDLKSTFGPEDVFYYAYAVFYSPSYRRRYAELLVTGFPRLPLTGDIALFRKLRALGVELVELHLMERLPESQARYPVTGDNIVEIVSYTEPVGGVGGRVKINHEQYFDNVPPQVWGYHIGGYQVCYKWLNDRKKKRWRLSFDDCKHYFRIVAAISRTIELQTEIDAAIGEWPLR